MITKDSMIWCKKSLQLLKLRRTNSLSSFLYMKKIFALVALLVYMLNISSLVHASTMGFFHTDNHQAMAHCHEQSSTSKTPNMDCCELVVSNQYSQTDIKIKSVYKLLSFVVSSVHIRWPIAIQQIEATQHKRGN